VSSKTEKATALFSSGFNCAQSVLAVFCEKYDLDENTALKISGGLGAGVRCGDICGAVSGAVLVIGLKHGHYISEDGISKSNCNSKTLEFIDLFKKKNGSAICREILGYDLSVKTEYEQAQNQNLFKTTCVDMVKSAVELLEDIDC